MQKDLTLRNIFWSVARRLHAESGVGASRVLHQNEIYYLSRACVFKSAPSAEEAKLTENQVYPALADIPSANIPGVDAFKPENMLDATALELPVKVFKEPGILMMVSDSPGGISPALWSLRKSGSSPDYYSVTGEVRCDQDFSQIPLRLYDLPPELISTAQDLKEDFSQLSPVLMEVRGLHVPVVTLTGDTGMLYVTLRQLEQTSQLTVCTRDGFVLKGTGWSDSKQAFKRFIIKEKLHMKGLTTPLATVKESSNDQPQQQQVRGLGLGAGKTATADPEEGKLGAAAGEAAAATGPEPPAPAVEIGSTGAAEQAGPVEEAGGVPAETSEPAKRTRARVPKAPKRAAIDYVGFTEQLSAAVEPVEAGNFDGALSELRSLRDLQIAAARRAANIATELHKAASSAVSKYAAIQQLLR